MTAGTEGSGGVTRTGEVQRRLNDGTYVHYAATRTYYSADGQTRVVQRYQQNGTVANGAYEEYRYDALGRRVLLRTRKATSPPAGGGTLALLCNSGPCASAISRWIWDGAQLLGETRAPGQDGLSAGQLDLLVGSAPHYGIVGYMHVGGWDEPRALMNGRVFNPNWRGLPESSVLFDGTVPDCSFGLGGSCMTVAWPTDVGTYFRRAVPPTTSPPTPTWLGSLAANGATGSGRLHRRFREFDPATGQFTQEDPIGLAGGANLYGFANGDPVNFGDPFGLCPKCSDNAITYSYRLFTGVWNRFAEKAIALSRAAIDLSPAGDIQRSADAFAEGRIGAGLAYGLLGAAGAVPGGSGAVAGSKSVVRGGLSTLGLSDQVARGVRTVLSSGAGQQWRVQALEGGGAMVSRWLKGTNDISSALYTYLIDAGGRVIGSAKQAYDAGGAIPGTLKQYR